MKNVAVLLITGSVYFSRFPTNIKLTILKYLQFKKSFLYKTFSKKANYILIILGPKKYAIYVVF